MRFSIGRHPREVKARGDGASQIAGFVEQTRSTLSRMDEAAWRRAARHVGVAMAIVGAVWLTVLMFLTVYIEPGGAGSLDCGQVWDSPQIEDFLTQD